MKRLTRILRRNILFENNILIVNVYNITYNNITCHIVSKIWLMFFQGTTILSAPRQIATIEVRELQKKLKAEYNIDVSNGIVHSLKPFFITYATDKEMSLCMCKLCLNAHLIFDLLMERAKKDGDETFDSLTEFFMAGCQCGKSVNGFYKWSCVNER